MVRSLGRSVLGLSLIALFAALLALAVPLGAVQAHAAYVSSTPGANSVLKAAPTQISITFAQNLDPKGLKIVVYDNKGVAVSQGDAQIASAKTATVTMTGDDSDIYRVDWQTTSAEDGEATLGAFVFAVDPSGSSDLVGGANAASSTGTPAWVAVLTGIAGLVVGFIIAFVVRGQRPQTAA